jgi:hypothetical protein
VQSLLVLPNVSCVCSPFFVVGHKIIGCYTLDPKGQSLLVLILVLRYCIQVLTSA